MMYLRMARVRLVHICIGISMGNYETRGLLL